MLQVIIKGTFRNNKKRAVGTWLPEGVEYRSLLTKENAELLDMRLGTMCNGHSFNSLISLNKFKRVNIKVMGSFCNNEEGVNNKPFTLDLGDFEGALIGSKIIDLANKAILKEITTTKYTCPVALKNSFPGNRIYC